MSPEQHEERVSELFEAALEIGANQRVAFLDQQCNDEKIRAKVESLLEKHERVGTFMEKPILESLIESQPKPLRISQEVLMKIGERYEDLIKVGFGGQAILYKARDRLTRQVVALKILRPDVASDEASIGRFKNELILAQKIAHKNVCSIRHFDLIDGVAYISMEFVEGETLREVLRRFGGLALPKGILIASQICDGLREAHSQGIVHRDLKPENIMIDLAGNAKIMDFGIARSIEAGMTHSTAIGTWDYMAPEQREGGNVDARADIYALGLILYEMFTGEKRGSEAPLRPREIEPTIPVYVEEVILRCLQRSPADRFQSVDELETALIRDSKVGPGSGMFITHARPISRALTWSANRLPAAIPIAIVCTLLTASLIAALFVGRAWRPAAPPARFAPAPAEPGPIMLTPKHEGEVDSVAFSPYKDGRWLASASIGDTSVKLWDVTSLQLRTLRGHTRPVNCVAFSPDGRWLASGSNDRTIKIWDVEAGREADKLRGGHTDDINSVAWSPDGRWLASGSEDQTVRLWDVKTKKGHKLPGVKGGIQEVAFSPDGRWLAAASSDEKVRLWDLKAHAKVQVLGVHAGLVSTVAFSLDSRWLASGGDDKIIKFWNVATGEEMPAFPGHTGKVTSLSFSPNLDSDRERLASASIDGAVKLWDIATGKELRPPLISGTVPVTAVAFSPDGNQLAVGFSDGTVELLPLKK